MARRDAIRGAQQSGALDFELITDATGFRALTPDWRRLMQETPWPEPMQEPLWMQHWMRVYGEDCDLAIGAFYERGALVGVAPLVGRAYHLGAGRQSRRLEFLGDDSDAPDGVSSCYLGLIAREGDEARVAAAFVQRVVGGEFGDYAECVFGMMLRGAPSTKALRKALEEADVAFSETELTPAYYVKLPQKWPEYLDTMRADRKAWLERCTRSFEEWAGEDWRIEKASDGASLKRGLRILGGLQRDSWEQQPDGSNRFVSFHQAYAAKMLAMGRLDFKWIQVGDTPLAVQYNLLNDTTVYAYRTVLDPQAPETVRVIMDLLAMQERVAAGSDEYDFMAGDAAYKRRFTEATRAMVQFEVGRPSTLDRARQWAGSALDAFRTVRKSANELDEDLFDVDPKRRR